MSTQITEKHCFVTVGATAGFDSLIEATLSPPFLKALKSKGYTNLQLQYGKDGAKLLEEFLDKAGTSCDGTFGLNITGFDFKKDGLGMEMGAAKGGNGTTEGVVISHAGTGTILAAFRIAVPIIVVPNPELLDNHQVELAKELAAQGYVVHGELHDLATAIQQAETLRERQHAWPPKNGEADPSGKGLIGVMDDEMGFLD